MIRLFDEMITLFRHFCRTFAAGFQTIIIKMAKTRQQEQATDYALDYLERLLKIEEIVGRSLDRRIDEAVRRYMKELKN